MRACFGLRCLIAFFAVCCAARGAEPGVLEELLKNGAAYSQQADYTQAIPILKQATRIAPENPDANFLLGVALLKSGQPADAVAPLRIAAKGRPGDVEVEGYLGDAEMEQQQFALAAEAFEAAVRRAPSSEQALIWWTDFSMERFRILGRWLRATESGRANILRAKAESEPAGSAVRESLYRQAAGIDPAMTGLWGEWGVVQAQLGMTADAQANLHKAQEQVPEASSTVELQALVAAADGNWLSAEQNLRTLAERSPDNFSKVLAGWPPRLVPGPNVHGPVWECLRNKMVSCPSAVPPGVKGIALSPQNLFAEGRWEQLAALPAPESEDTNGWYWRGVALHRLGRCGPAIPALERGLKAEPEAAASRLTECYELAVVGASDRLDAEGKEVAVHQIRGDIFLSLKNSPSSAVEEYTSALRLKPQDPNLLEKLAEAYFNLGDMERTRQSAQAALQQDPHRELALRLLTRVAMSERDYDTALTLLDRLEKIEPMDAWMGVQEGTAYSQTGHPSEAVQRLKAALDSGYPDEKGALHAILAGQLRKLGRENEATLATAEAVKLADAFQQHSQSTVDIDDSH